MDSASATPTLLPPTSSSSPPSPQQTSSSHTATTAPITDSPLSSPIIRPTTQPGETCPLCTTDDEVAGTWICCDVCNTWFHVVCLKLSLEEFESIDSYHCDNCVPTAGPSTQIRKSSRKQDRVDYADLNNGVISNRSKWEVLLSSKKFLPDNFERMEGSKVTSEWVRQTGFLKPIVIPASEDALEGLGMKMPPRTTTVKDIRDIIGPDTVVEVIDVATQSELLGWNLEKWAEYFEMEPKERVYNVISLEFTGSKFQDLVQRPTVVRDLDWIDNFWPKASPSAIRQGSTDFPKVQLYCLMSVKDSFTDFHIDFAGSSVFYHILSGSKTFYFVEPTPANLRKYAKWSSSSDQSTDFFGDVVGGKCYKVELSQGDTMMIPSGWIHSVYTPSTSVVIGGNFVHSFHIPMQYEVGLIEQLTNVPFKFRFPSFEKLSWYVVQGYVDRLIMAGKGKGTRSRAGEKKKEQGMEDVLDKLSSQELKGLMQMTFHLWSEQKKLLKKTPKVSSSAAAAVSSLPPVLSPAVSSLGSEERGSGGGNGVGVLESKPSPLDTTVHTPVMERTASSSSTATDHTTTTTATTAATTTANGSHNSNSGALTQAQRQAIRSSVPSTVSKHASGKGAVGLAVMLNHWVRDELLKRSEPFDAAMVLQTEVEEKLSLSKDYRKSKKAEKLVESSSSSFGRNSMSPGPTQSQSSSSTSPGPQKLTLRLKLPSVEDTIQQQHGHGNGTNTDSNNNHQTQIAVGVEKPVKIEKRGRKSKEEKEESILSSSATKTTTTTTTATNSTNNGSSGATVLPKLKLKLAVLPPTPNTTTTTTLSHPKLPTIKLKLEPLSSSLKRTKKSSLNSGLLSEGEDVLLDQEDDDIEDEGARIDDQDEGYKDSDDDDEDDDEDSDDEVDVGGLEPGSSDSEYDEQKKKSSSRSRRNSGTTTGSHQRQRKNSAPMTPINPLASFPTPANNFNYPYNKGAASSLATPPQKKRSDETPETVFFDDVELMEGLEEVVASGGHGNESFKVSRGEKRKQSPVLADATNAGTSSSFGGGSLSSTTTTTTTTTAVRGAPMSLGGSMPFGPIAKRPATKSTMTNNGGKATGKTAKERIASKLFKKR